jgi:hypothetical protein
MGFFEVVDVAVSISGHLGRSGVRFSAALLINPCSKFESEEASLLGASWGCLLAAKIADFKE